MRLVFVLALICAPVFAMAQGFDALQQPGAIAVMRHALAPGTGDPAGFDVTDCATQRNLDARGRAQAERIGAALRAEGIAFTHVWTSRWCRCRETAELLALGPVTEQPPLNSFFQDRARAEPQTRATLAALRDLPEGARPMLVTHQVNITALTGVFPASGEIVVIRLDPAGAVTVLDRIEIAP